MLVSHYGHVVVLIWVGGGWERCMSRRARGQASLRDMLGQQALFRLADQGIQSPNAVRAAICRRRGGRAEEENGCAPRREDVQAKLFGYIHPKLPGQGNVGYVKSRQHRRKIRQAIGCRRKCFAQRAVKLSDEQRDNGTTPTKLSPVHIPGALALSGKAFRMVQTLLWRTGVYRNCSPSLHNKEVCTI